MNKGEKPIECAFREFKEETGYEAKKMKPLLTFYPQVGYNMHKVHCFVATGIKKTGMPKLDKEEFLDVMKINVEVLVKMILSGEIVDSMKDVFGEWNESTVYWLVKSSFNSRYIIILDIYF